MKNPDSTNSQNSSQSADAKNAVFSPWQQLKGKRISYLTLPLLVMATITEFVILATGWKYQQTVCLPPGMAVTFFGIGPIGATILAVELLKLPLAIWTASRQGLQKGVMLVIGLPLICLLTFQLVKDMAVYEMGIALTPASQMLEAATKEEVKINQLNGELAAIDGKKTDREAKLAELAARKAKANADLEESLKRNDDARQDAISLTDYQKKELSEVDSRQATIIQQFDADAAQITKTIADLRDSRENELTRAARWNAEEARIDNAYNAKMADYTNLKTAYEKARDEYDNANFFKRQLMKEPVDPGVPPEREANMILKPAAIAAIDAQIQAKQAELLTVNNQRRDRVAQVDESAHDLRKEFDSRSTTKREESDRKRDELLAGQAVLAAQWTADEKQIDQEFEVAAQKVDGIRAELDDARKKAEGLYESREASIKTTQVHRIATTVEIVRGLLKGERPASIKLTAKERGDLYTDQINMVRIWVYPVLAFIVAFLPTLMVEIGFSTLFHPEQQRPQHRLGFFGRRLHWLHVRAGRQKILRAERIASEASAAIAIREKALATAKADADKALAEKEAELQTTRATVTAAAAEHQEQLERQEAEYAEQSKNKEEEWVANLAGMADSLNRTVIEKDALRDLQKSEIERQIQMRQNAWSDRLTQLRQELDDQRTAAETERTALMQAQHKKLLEVSEESKSQVIQARRQAADAELAAVEATAKLTHDLKEALHTRDTAQSQLQQQTDSLSFKLSQAREDAAREVEKATRQEKHRLERQQLEFGKTLRQREEDFAHQLKQREQELALGFEARLGEEQARIEQDARRREAELERQIEVRALEVDARWKQEAQHREEAAQIRLKQREQQLSAQADARLNEAQTQAEQKSRRRELELEHVLETKLREADTRSKQELQQQELALQAKLKQREQELALKADARLAGEQARIEQDARRREAELERQIEVRALEVDARWKQEAQQREEAAQIRLKQREQQLQAQTDARLSEAQTQAEQKLRRRELELEHQLETKLREADARLAGEQARIEQDARRRDSELELQVEARTLEIDARSKQEAQQREEAAQIRLKQREQQLLAQADARLSEAQTQAEQKLRRRELELEHQLETRLREADTRLRQELQQQEVAFEANLKQREQELTLKAGTRETELQKQLASDLRVREEEWEHQAEARVLATETRLSQEAQKKEELSLAKSRQRDQQWQMKLDAIRAELQARNEDDLRRREMDANIGLREMESMESLLRKEMEQKEEAAQAKAKQREQELVAQLTAQTEARQMAAQTEWEIESEKKVRSAVEPFKALLARTEKERDEARQAATENTREVQALEKKLTEASSFLSGWRNGKSLVGNG